MHRMKTGMKGHVGLLAGIAALVAAVGVLPMFGSTAYAAGTNMQGVAVTSEFVIPGVPVTKVQETAVQANTVVTGPDSWQLEPKPPSSTFQFDRVEFTLDPNPGAGNVLVTCKSPPQSSKPVEKKETGPPALLSANFNSDCKGAVNVAVTTGPGPVMGPKGELIHRDGMDGAQQPPFKLTLTDNISGLFPKSGELVLDKTELIVYDNNSAAPECLSLTKTQVCVTARAKVGDKKAHVKNTKVKLATQLLAPITVPTSGPKDSTNAATGGAETTLESDIAAATAPPFAITIGNRGNFPATGSISVTHQVVQTSNQIGGQGSELMKYDLTSCGAIGANQLCINARGQQPGNETRTHKKDGTAQPAGQNMRSKVKLHFQIQVKANGNASFFPSGTLIIYDIGPGNTPQNEELFGYHNAAPKVKPVTVPGNQFHITSRGGAPSAFKKTAIVAHPAGSIVTGPDNYLVCRSGGEQPMPNEPAAQNPAGSSVAQYVTCYAQTQPNGPPKNLTPKALKVPINNNGTAGSLITLNALAQPFLSTGGFNHILFGAVPHVDTNGTTDGTLSLASPCITDFTPGTNLQVNLTVSGTKQTAAPWQGSITVVLDTIHDQPNDQTTPADNCDDPAGTGDITMTVYDQANAVDTDGDGCTDIKELDPDQTKGGLRDPWNPHDFFDVGSPAGIGVKDQVIDLFNDIVQTITAFGAYHVAADRGALKYGPFNHNRSDPDGVVDLFNDIVGVIQDFGHDCSK